MNSTARPELPFWPVTVLIVAYPLTLHLSVSWADARPVAAVLAALCLWGAARCWAQQRRGGMALALLGVLGIALLVAREGLLPLLYWQPVIIGALGGWLFGRTLVSGRVPLITRLARLARGELPPELLRYTRQVTLAWTLVFALLTLELLLLRLWATPTVWSLFANAINYLLIALFFVGEYAVRVVLFRHLEHPGFVSYLRTLNRPELRAVLRRPWA